MMVERNQGILFSNLPPGRPKAITFRHLERPLWTENKAKLIERYLRYFVFITRHGCYIDGFAGPQRKGVKNSWAAKLVIESRPKWLREFWLCEIKPDKLDLLEQMVASQEKVSNRRIHVEAGDFNQTIDRILERCRIRERTASFCLLDQHTFECEWQTLQKVAEFKPEGYKIELLYFLASGWLDRSLKGTTKNTDVIERWWGHGDWRKLSGMDIYSRASLLAERFKKELGYTHVYPWPIHKRGKGKGRVMFHMVHASDHPLAPGLMARAYTHATRPPEPEDDLQIEMSLLGGAGIRPVKV